MNHRSKALRESARDETCVACGRKDGSVVWSHSNEQIHGKGMSIKAHDLLGNYLCGECHAWYDTSRATRSEKQQFFRNHYHRTMVRVAEKLANGTLKL